jgi:hypothetical protein
MTRKYTDNAGTTLAQQLLIGGTTLQVAAGKGDNFPAVTGRGAAGSAPDYFVITLEDAAGNREKIKVEQRAAGNDVLGSVGYPLVRAYDGTVARQWNPGDIVDLRWEKSEAIDVEDKIQAGAVGRLFGLKGSTTNGLNMGFYGGQLVVDGVITAIADAVLALTAAQTNYIERTVAGVVSTNIVGFSADKIPLYQITTDAGGITAIVDKRSANLPTFGYIQKSLAAGGTIVLTADEARAEMIEFTGVLPNNTNVEFPNVKRMWLIRNSCTGSFSITPKVNGQAGAAMPASTQGKRMLIYGDGTDIRAGGSAIGANYSEFASGTPMLFVQTSAPLGWTKSTTHNNKALRIVSGAAGSGGSDAFTSVFGAKSTNGFTLTTNEMPSHSHNFTGRDNIGSTAKPAAAIDPQDLLTYTTQATGSSGAHAHTIPTIDLAYVDVIIATKD